MKLKTFGLAGIALCWSAGAAFAHHSFSMFDGNKTVSIAGTVVQYEWSNPHMWLHMMAPDTEGKTYRWSLEMGGPAQLSQRGWAPDTVAPGDKVTVTMHPLKDGSHGGQLLSIVLPSGKRLTQLKEDQPGQ